MVASCQNILPVKVSPTMDGGLRNYPCKKTLIYAFVNTNPLVNGLSGMLGRTLVFKNYHGKTIVASRPRPPKTQSENQRVNRSKFRDASRWARAELYNPVRKAYYQQKARQLNLPNAYTAAITDYMRKPEVMAWGLKLSLGIQYFLQ